MASNTFSNIVTKPQASPFATPNRPMASPFATALNNISSGVKTQVPQPSTPLKATTTTNVDGSSTKQEFHNTPSGASGSWDTTGNQKGLLNTNPTGQPQNIGLTEQQVRDNLSKSGFNFDSASIHQPQNTNPQQTDTQEQNNRNISNPPVQNPVQNTNQQRPSEQLANSGLYGQIIGQGLGKTQEAGDYAKQAAILAKAMQTGVNNQMGDPTYSGEARIGRSGLIQSQLGAELQSLAALQGASSQQAQGFNTAAGLAGTTVNQAGVVIDRTTGKPIVGNPADLNNIISQGAAYDARVKQNAAYQQGLQNLRAADAIQSQIVGTLANNPTLNNTPISAITNLRQWLAGQTSDPAQQVLSQQVANYIQSLGMSPDQAATIASQKGGTIATLLENLRTTFENQNNANLGASNGSGGSGSQNDPLNLGI